METASLGVITVQMPCCCSFSILTCHHTKLMGKRLGISLCISAHWSHFCHPQNEGWLGARFRTPSQQNIHHDPLTWGQMMSLNTTFNQTRSKGKRPWCNCWVLPSIISESRWETRFASQCQALRKHWEVFNQGGFLLPLWGMSCCAAKFRWKHLSGDTEMTVCELFLSSRLTTLMLQRWAA